MGAVACSNNKGASGDAADNKTATVAAEPEGLVIMTKNDCATCHNAEAKIVGPSFKDIAAKYPNTPENVALLAGKVMAGGSGVWGSTPMVAHPNVTKEDAEKMVTYILTSGKQK